MIQPKAILISLFCFLQMLMISAQSKNEQSLILNGHVVDSFTGCGVENAMVFLLSVDSVIIDSTMVNYKNKGMPYMDSYYQFKIPAVHKKYIIKVQQPEYHDCYVDYEVKYIARNTEFDVPRHLMTRKQESNGIYKNVNLKEVTVQGTRIKFVYRGDTLVVNAAALRLPNGSMLDELVKQMPGVSMTDDGDIFMNGRKVDYLLLNGKRFFKGKNRVMLDNLGAYTVDNIRFYTRDTEKNRYTQMGDEQKEYVMDVRLKKEYVNGYLVNTEAGVGSQHRYAQRTFAIRSTRNSHLTIFNNLNNTNETGRPQTDGNWKAMTSQQGQMNNKSIGLNLSIEDRKGRFSESLFGEIAWRKNLLECLQASESFLPTGNNRTDDDIRQQSRGLFSYVNQEFKWQKGVLIEIGTHLIYNNTKSSKQQMTDTYDEEHINQQLTHQLGATRMVSIWNKIDVTKKLKWGDVLSLQGEVLYKTNNNQNDNNYQTSYFLQPDCNKTMLQNMVSPQKSFQHHEQIGYSMHFNNGWNSEIKYRYDYLFDRDSRTLYQATTDEPLANLPSNYGIDLMRIDLQNSYHQNTWAHRHTPQAHIFYIYQHHQRNTRLDITLRLNYLKERMHYERNITDTTFERRSWMFAPKLHFETYTKRNSLRISYLQENLQPAMNKLVDMTDTSQPLVVQRGNPNLKSTLHRELTLGYSHTLTPRQQLFSATTRVDIWQRQLANSLTYDRQTGIYTYRPVNINGNWMADTRVQFNRQLSRNRRWTVRERLEWKYVCNVDMVQTSKEENGSESRIHNHVLSNQLQVNYQHNTFSFTAEGQLAWNRALSRRPTFDNISAIDYHYGIISTFVLPYAIGLSTDIRMYSLRGYSSKSMNGDHLICNLAVSRSLLNHRLMLRLECRDLFNQLPSVNHVINGQGRIEQRYNTLRGYIMLRMEYRLNIKAQRRHP